MLSPHWGRGLVVVRKRSLELDDNVLLLVLLAGRLAEAFVPLVGTTLHVHPGTMYLLLRETASQERTEVPGKRQEREGGGERN